MANKETGRKAARVIAWVLIVLLLLGVIGVVLKFTNGGNEEFKTFYLTYAGKDILTTKSKAEYVCGTEQRYDVKYTFDTANAEPRGYNMKIIPNAEVNFSFTADGVPYSWGDDLDDITMAFDLTKESTYFTLSLPADMTIETVLNGLYAEKDIRIPDGVERKAYFYTLIVSSYNQAVTYSIDFAVQQWAISLDATHLVV